MSSEAETWELPHGKGQGPRPSQKLPPLKISSKNGKSKNLSGKYGKPFNGDIT